MGERVVSDGQGRVINSTFLNFTQDGKGMLGVTSLWRQMRAIFETRADLGLIEGGKIAWTWHSSMIINKTLEEKI